VGVTLFFESILNNVFVHGKSIKKNT
jgi:hypothetical protein